MSETKNLAKALGLRILHVGVNAQGAEDADRLAALFQEKLGLQPEDKGLSIFSSGLIEIMKEDGPGTKGHIALGCDCLEEAVACLAQNGVGVDEATTRKYDPDGSLRVAYLQGEYAGFAVHLKEYPKA